MFFFLRASICVKRDQCKRRRNSVLSEQRVHQDQTRLSLSLSRCCVAGSFPTKALVHLQVHRHRPFTVTDLVRKSSSFCDTILHDDDRKGFKLVDTRFFECLDTSIGLAVQLDDLLDGGRDTADAAASTQANTNLKDWRL